MYAAGSEQSETHSMMLRCRLEPYQAPVNSRFQKWHRLGEWDRPESSGVQDYQLGQRSKYWQRMNPGTRPEVFRFQIIQNLHGLEILHTSTKARPAEFRIAFQQRNLSVDFLVSKAFRDHHIVLATLWTFDHGHQYCCLVGSQGLQHLVKCNVYAAGYCIQYEAAGGCLKNFARPELYELNLSHFGASQQACPWPLCSIRS